MNVNNDFNLASEGTQKQKWELEDRERQQRISNIQSPETRQMMQHYIARRDDHLNEMANRQARERERKVQDIAQGRVQPAPGMDLRPAGAAGLSPEAKMRLIRDKVNATFAPMDRKELEEARAKTNLDIDRQLDGIERDEGRSQKASKSASAFETQKDEAKAKLEKMRENAHDITQRIDRSRGPGRGRSR